MMNLPDQFTMHVVSVRPIIGGGGMGPRFGDPVTMKAIVTDEQKLIRSADGSEIVSSSDVYVTAHVKVGSLVTLWPGTPSARESSVVAVAKWEHTRLPNYYVLSLR